MILSNFNYDKRVERGVGTSLVTGFLGLAYEGISIYLYIKSHEPLQKDFGAMKRNVELSRNKIYHLENSMIIYGVCNVETLDRIVNLYN